MLLKTVKIGAFQTLSPSIKVFQSERNQNGSEEAFVERGHLLEFLLPRRDFSHPNSLLKREK